MTYTAMITTVTGYGDRTLDVTPGPEGSSDTPILTLPLEFDPETDECITDTDAVLAAHGWKTIPAPVEPGVAPQFGHWTTTDFGAVASVAPIA